MSEESLRRFLDLLSNDQGFVERLKNNAQEALSEFDLSATERVALGTNDEDGLRRLAGLDVAGFQVYRVYGGVYREEPTLFGCPNPLSQVSGILCATGLFCVC